MRQIKFRAWDLVKKEMKPVWSIGFKAWDGQEESFINYVEICRDGTVQVDEIEVILMQYTGLKDKNGVEVYEGDIIKALHDFGPGGWHKRTATVSFNLMNGYVWNYWDIDSIEIIGNIHENPELLK